MRTFKDSINQPEESPEEIQEGVGRRIKRSQGLELDPLKSVIWDTRKVLVL